MMIYYTAGSELHTTHFKKCVDTYAMQGNLVPCIAKYIVTFLSAHTITESLYAGSHAGLSATLGTTSMLCYRLPGSLRL